MTTKRHFLASLIATALLCMICSGPVMAGGHYSITSWTIAGGGTMEATGGDWTLAGTIGQWEATEARALSGGQWRLTGGFWGFTLEELSEFLFRDRFEANGQTQSMNNHVEAEPAT